MLPEGNKTRKIICQDKVCHVCYFVDAAVEQCFIRSHNPDELCQEIPVEALTDRLKLAKRIQCRANNFLLLGNAPNVHHATGDAQSQFRPRISSMQQRCQPPENTSRWLNKLVVKVKVFKTNINKMVYQVRLIQLPPVKVVHPEKKTCHGHTKRLDWLGTQSRLLPVPESPLGQQILYKV